MFSIPVNLPSSRIELVACRVCRRGMAERNNNAPEMREEVGLLWQHCYKQLAICTPEETLGYRNCLRLSAVYSLEQLALIYLHFEAHN